MISVIQQFYMIPLFRKIILTVETDKTDPDNILFQLQKMFSYLNNSNRKFYSLKHLFLVLRIMMGIQLM